MLWVPKYQQWMSLEELSYREMLKKAVIQEHLKSGELRETPLTCRARPSKLLIPEILRDLGPHPLYFQRPQGGGGTPSSAARSKCHSLKNQHQPHPGWRLSASTALPATTRSTHNPVFSRFYPQHLHSRRSSPPVLRGATLPSCCKRRRKNPGGRGTILWGGGVASAETVCYADG